MAALGRAVRALRALRTGARGRAAGPAAAVTLPRAPLGAEPHEEEPMAVAQRKVGGAWAGQVKGRGGREVGGAREGRGSGRGVADARGAGLSQRWGLGQGKARGAGLWAGLMIMGGAVVAGLINGRGLD